MYTPGFPCSVLMGALQDLISEMCGWPESSRKKSIPLPSMGASSPMVCLLNCLWVFGLTPHIPYSHRGCSRGQPTPDSEDLVSHLYQPHPTCIMVGLIVTPPVVPCLLLLLLLPLVIFLFPIVAHLLMWEPQEV